MTSNNPSRKILYPIEHRVVQRQNRQKIQDIVLVGLYTTAAAGLAMAAPNTLRLLGYVQKYVGPQKNVDSRMYQALARLRARGLVTRQNILTKAGKGRAAALNAVETIAPKIPLRWDKKWRLIMFDIWEKRKAERNQLRGMLERVGFTKLQESVWVFPYPCEELFVYLQTQLRLGPSIRYLVVEEIDNDHALRHEFDLPKR